MTREEHLKFCSICNHRKMDMKQGLLCELTQAKADFEEKCDNFEVDQKAAEKEARIAKEREEENGTPEPEESDEDARKRGTYWLRLIGALSLVNIALELYGWRFEVGLGVTTIASFLLGSVGIGIAVVISIMYIVLSYIAKHYEAEWAYRLGFISYVVDTLSIAALGFGGMIEPINILTHISILTALYVRHSAYEKCTHQKAKSGAWSKSRRVITVIMSLIMIGTIALAAWFVKTAAHKSDKEDLASYIERCKSSLKEDKSADVYCSNIELKENFVVVSFHDNSYKNSDMSPEVLNAIKIYKKENLIFGFEGEINYKLLERCQYTNCGYAINYYDKDNNLSFMVSLTPSEVKTYGNESAHKTSKQVWSNFLREWNKQFPIDFGGVLCTSAELRNDTAFYNYTMSDVTIDALENITENGMKASLRENLEEVVMADCYFLLALYNEMYIGFNYTATCSPGWNAKIVFSPAEMVDIIESLSGE